MVNCFSNHQSFVELEESFAFTDGDGDGIPRIDIGIIDFTF